MFYWHNMNVEAGHLVQGVEHDGVLPGQDGDGEGAVAQHKVCLEPRAAESRVRTDPAQQRLQHCRYLQQTEHHHYNWTTLGCKKVYICYLLNIIIVMFRVIYVF